MKNELMEHPDTRLDFDAALCVSQIVKSKIDSRTNSQRTLLEAKSGSFFKTHQTRSLARGWIRYANEDIKLMQKSAEEKYAEYSKLDESFVAKSFIESVSSRARRMNNPTLASELEDFVTMSPGEKVLNTEASLLASVIETISLRIASTEKKKKDVTIKLFEGEKIYGWNPLSDIIDGEDYHEARGVVKPDTTIVKDVYKLIGFDNRISDIPTDMPGFRRVFPREEQIFPRLSVNGVILTFDLEGPTERGGEELRYYPGNINLSISKPK